MIEVVGQPSSAKSAFGYTAIGAFQRAGGKCILIDSEQKADRSFIERLGVNFDDLSYSRGGSIKEVIQIIGRVAQMADPKVPVLVVWDSIAATPGSEELELHTSDKEFTGEKAARARYLSAAFRAVCNDLARKKVTLLAINQLRTKFNFMGSVSEEAPGGKAPKYHAAVRLYMRETGKIKHRDSDIIVGIMVQVKAIKNACAPPFRHSTVRFKFDTGFDLYSGLDELLLRHRRIEQKAGWLCYKDRTFRAGDIERIITEIPDLIAPLSNTIERDEPQDMSSTVHPKQDTTTGCTPAEESEETAKEH